LATRAHSITAEQYRHSFEGHPGLRDELINGRIVMHPLPKPLHQHVRQNIVLLLDAACEGTGYIANGNSNIELTPFDMPSPDVFVVSIPAWERAMQEGKYLNVKPLMAVEVLSPSEDVSEKVNIYLTAQVDAVWVVDPTNRTVLVYASLKKLPCQEHSEISLPSPLQGAVEVDDIFAGLSDRA
jgi:Uma2 family endonuclease